MTAATYSAVEALVLLGKLIVREFDLPRGSRTGPPLIRERFAPYIVFNRRFSGEHIPLVAESGRDHGVGAKLLFKLL